MGSYKLVCQDIEEFSDKKLRKKLVYFISF